MGAPANAAMNAARSNRRAAGIALAQAWREANHATFEAMDRAGCFSDSWERHPIRHAVEGCS